MMSIAIAEARGAWQLWGLVGFLEGMSSKENLRNEGERIPATGKAEVEALH